MQESITSFNKTMDDIITQIPLILLYLNNNGGKEVVKKASMDFYDWLKGKIPSKGKQLEALKENPSNKKSQNELQVSIEAAKTLDLLDLSELKSKTKEIVDLLKREDMEWFNRNQQQFVNISITQNHSGTGDNVAGDKIVGK